MAEYNEHREITIEGPDLPTRVILYAGNGGGALLQPSTTIRRFDDQDHVYLSQDMLITLQNLLNERRPPEPNPFTHAAIEQTAREKAIDAVIDKISAKFRDVDKKMGEEISRWNMQINMHKAKVDSLTKARAADEERRIEAQYILCRLQDVADEVKRGE